MKISIESAYNKIQNAIKSSDIFTLALVSDTSYEVVFYANVDGLLLQSNTLAENGILDIGLLDAYSEEVASAVRKSTSYQSGRLNIVSFTGCIEQDFRTEELQARVHKIKKEWRNNLRTV